MIFLLDSPEPIMLIPYPPLSQIVVLRMILSLQPAGMDIPSSLLELILESIIILLTPFNFIPIVLSVIVEFIILIELKPSTPTSLPHKSKPFP